VLTFAGFNSRADSAAAFTGRPAGIGHDVSVPVAPLPSSSVEPELCVVVRRNDSLGARGRWTAFCLVGGASLALGVAFVAAGAWPVLPWSLAEVTLLGAAFAWLERRSHDWERLTVQGDSVVVERMRSGTLVRREWKRYWLRVDAEPAQGDRPAHLLLRSGADACEFGAALPAEARGEVVSQLRRLLSQ
jgi:uncharacterized membrane protein